MQSIEMLNILENARNRANAQAQIVEKTRKEHDAAMASGLNNTAKRLRTNLKRQEMALALTQSEIREIEAAVAKEGDLVTPKNGGKK